GGPADLLRELAPERAGGPEFVHEPARGSGIAAPADLHLDVSRFPHTAGALELGDGLTIGRARDEAVADAPGDLRHLRSARRDIDRWRSLAERIEARVLDGAVRTAEAPLSAAAEKAQDFDRLLEHLAARLEWRPAATDDVLVQVLPGADTQEESAIEHHGCCRRSLSDDRRVDPDGRARHPRADS